MRKITSVSMSEQLDGFVQRMVESGRYGSISEVMRSALRLLEQQENQNDAIRKAVIDGLESGESSLTLRDIAEQRKRKHNV
ncbi:type II toxin-antitoxin system ParD family antitoxin [Xenorhabdus doucetiae]|uniref:Antitoxin ParD n=1 Tax=Xenorhabdus doucetiae TaxID=351671 RepID=A0A068QN84_9GAMM|nr:type II toxin-antitoxin system ParD family antitoxin [Xenorhabdus doucetiae]TYP15880.1 antitoxin ParD1/3/4 [Xenorhabdus doucetiae]CDG16169.1 putative counterpart of the neighbouring ParE-like protein [Xenorhabdus doucetiae]